MIPFAAAMMWVVSQSARQKVLLSSRVLSWIGLRCFGFYLLHEWVIHFLPLAKYPWHSIAIYLLVTPIVAAASFRWFESPFLRLVKSSGSTSTKRQINPEKGIPDAEDQASRARFEGPQDPLP
jgi:peptidoglycan/LPS O-acetylase OafA/YrhL